MNITYSSSLCSDAIKIFWVKYNIKKHGNQVKQIITSNAFLGKDFDGFMDILMKPVTIEIFQKYFNYLRLFLKLNGTRVNPCEITPQFVRVILSSYTIKYYPDIMNVDKQNEVSKLLLGKTQSLVLGIKIINSIKIAEKFSFSSLKCMIKFFTKCLEFRKIFNEWKKIDMEAVICNLAKVYIDLEREFKDLQNSSENEELLKVTEQNFENEKKRIISKARKISPNQGIEIFNKYYIFLNQEIDLNIYKQRLSTAIETNLRKAYWDLIKTDMLKIPPDYTKVIELLEESKSLLIQCTPRRQDLINEINMNIEVDTLRHYIENDVDVLEFIQRMMNFILKKIEEYQSQDEVEGFNKFKDDFQKLNSQDSTKLSEVLIYFFQGVMPRLTFILESKRNFEEWIAKNKQ